LGSIALCGRCRREHLPRLAQPSWHREKHRATKAEREPEPSPAAQKVLRKKAKQDSLRRQIKLHGLIETTKIFLALRAGQLPPQAAPQEDCEHCLKLQSA